MYLSPDHSDHPHDSNSARQGYGSSSDDGKDEVVVSAVDYLPLELLRCGSRFFPQSTVNLASNSNHTPQAPAVPRVDRKEVEGIRGGTGQRSRRGGIALFSTSVEGSCGSAPLRHSSIRQSHTQARSQ
jgi:hypothetical protein